MINLFYLLAAVVINGNNVPQQHPAERQVLELFRLRNEHKADSAERFYADTVKVYMKFLRNIPRRVITKSDKAFWKTHPRNKFEITGPLKVTETGEGTTVTFTGNEYLDGTAYLPERIEIRFNKAGKIYYYRGFSLKKPG